MANNFPRVLFTFSLVLCFLSVHSSVEAASRKIRNPVPQDNFDYTNGSSEDFDDDESSSEEEDPLEVKKNEDKHPCTRPCEKGKPMTCRYTFTIEYFTTMSKACGDCPYNMTECYNNECIPGDGVKRTILVVNRQMPGPAIDVCLGDTIEVDVANRMLDVSSTIHWHGLLQEKTPFMDGVPFVSQCLIAPQENFLYRFYADNPGTHLWHAHSALQRGDGLHGPLIIRTPPSQNPHLDLYDYDLPEHVINLLDWTHMLSATKFISHYHETGDNKPPSILVNGGGRYQEFFEADNIIYTPAPRFVVQKGKRYRFRLINAGFLNCPVEMTIDNHPITVIASDGGNLKPVKTDTLITVAGERFDFILHANQTVENYWIRFRGLLDCGVKKAIQVGILHYKGADKTADPEGDVTYDNSIATGFKVNAVNTPASQSNTMVMSELSALNSDPNDPVLKPEPDVRFYIPYDFYPVDNTHFHKSTFKKRSRTPQLNHIAMEFPNFPVMADLAKTDALRTCNGSTVSMECRHKFCECPHVLVVPLNAVVEVIMIDEGVPFDANHPFHLHGYNFRLLGMDRLGSSVTEEEVRLLDSEGKLKRNLVDPPIKDTITVPDGGYAIYRFHATNPGFWILHCHLDFHVEMGMALLFKIGENTDFRPPPEDLPLCGHPFRPIPVNQTNSIYAQFFPTPEEGINYNCGFNNSRASSPSKVSFVCIILLSLFFINK